MEELIMSQFENMNSKAGDVLPMRNLNLGLFQKLNPKELEEAINATNNLIRKGHIIHEGENTSMECLRLTELGYNNLYSNSKSVSDLENLIMNQFEKQNSRAGDMVMMRSLNVGLISTLNPVEKKLFDSAANNLINKGLVTYEKGNLECLRLTEDGYETLY